MLSQLHAIKINSVHVASFFKPKIFALKISNSFFGRHSREKDFSGR
jgi:hypothetical protein